MMDCPSSSSSSHINENLSTKLANLSINELKKRDCFGNTILHLICKTGKNERLKSLLKNKNLNLMTIDFESGWNCLHITIFHKHISMANLIMQFAFSNNKLEMLLKQKDREGFTPMDLLSSEIEFKRLSDYPSVVGGLKLPKNEITKYQIRETQLQNLYELNDEGQWNHKHIDIFCYDSEYTICDELITMSNDIYDHFDFTLGDTGMSGLEFRNGRYFPGKTSRLHKALIRSVAMSNKHSIVLTEKGFFVSGFGSKGRLGLGNVKNYKDNFVRMPDLKGSLFKRSIAVSENHSLIIIDGKLFTFGSNEFGCLGLNDNNFEQLSPKEVFLKRDRRQYHYVACSKIHSICYGNSQSVLLWGLNIGQMGFTTVSSESVVYKNQTGFIQRQPQEITFDRYVRYVVCSEIATLVMTDGNEFHLYMNGFHAKFQPPQYNKPIDNLYAFKPIVLTGKLKVVKLVCRAQFVLILYDNGNILQFTLNQKITNAADFLKDLKYNYVWKASKDHLKCIDVDMGEDGSIVICVQDGSVYKRIKRPLQKKKGIFKFTKLPNVSNIEMVSTDPDFKKFLFVRKKLKTIPMVFDKDSFFIDIERLSLLGPEQRKIFGKYVRLGNYLAEKSNYEKPSPGSMGSIIWNLTYGRDQPLMVIPDYADCYIGRNSDDLEVTYKIDSSVADLEKMLMSTEELEKKLKQHPPTEYYMKSSDNVIIPIHKVLLYDYGVFKKVFDGETVSARSKSMYLSGNVINVTGFNHRSILDVIHYIYTGRSVTVNNPDPKTTSDEIVQLHKEILALREFVLHGPVKPHNFVHLIDSDYDDTVIHLLDGSISCYSFILRATSSYFETVLNWKWNGSLKYEIDLRHIDKDVCMVILKYLYGGRPQQIFDDLEFSDAHEFINFVLSCIETTDELLLIDLRNFLEYYVSTFVDVRNVLLIMKHAFELGCNKLFEICLWFVYNNLPLLLFDEEFNEIVNGNNINMIKRMDYSFRFYSNLKKERFGVDIYKLDNWYEKKADHLIRSFIYEMENFNKLFNSENVKPIFEVVEKKERKQSQSQSSSVPPVLPKPKAPSPSPPPQSQDNDSAILDDHDEEEQNWEVFSKRRRSSAIRRLSMNNNNNNINNNSIALTEPSPSFKARQNSIIVKEKEDQIEPIKIKAKIKVQKPSQRERKKSLFEPPISSSPMSAESSSSRSITPVWNINTPSKLKQITPINSPTSSSLGGTPSLSEIMFEQEKLLNPQQKPVKSLEEIQLEEEFERWWQEESLKFQNKEEQLLSHPLQSPESSKPKNKKKYKNIKNVKNRNNDDHRRSSS